MDVLSLPLEIFLEMCLEIWQDVCEELLGVCVLGWVFLIDLGVEWKVNLSVGLSIVRLSYEAREASSIQEKCLWLFSLEIRFWLSGVVNEQKNYMLEFILAIKLLLGAQRCRLHGEWNHVQFKAVFIVNWSWGWFLVQVICPFEQRDVLAWQTACVIDFGSKTSLVLW